jgi:hypothetical protein
VAGDKRKCAKKQAGHPFSNGNRWQGIKGNVPKKAGHQFSNENNGGKRNGKS